MIIVKKDQLKIFIPRITFINELMMIFLCNHNGQIFIDNCEELFIEL